MAALRVIACLLALVLAAGATRAADATACQSILANDRDCPPLPRVTAKGDLRVEIFTRKRTAVFALSQVDPDLREEFASYCAGGKCTCDEIVQYLDFKGPVPGFRQVNAFEYEAGRNTKCSVQNSTVARDVLHFAVSNGFVSTAIFELEYCHGCNGSCHGGVALRTFEARTGRALTVRDMLKPTAAAALKQHMIDYAVKTYGSDSDAGFVRRQLGDELARRALVGEGFYVESGTAFVNLDSFVFSCADGSFFPVPVPRELVAPAFAAAL